MVKGNGVGLNLFVVLYIGDIDLVLLNEDFECRLDFVDYRFGLVGFGNLGLVVVL